MKVLIISGSPRQKGNTSIALNEIAQQLAKQGVEREPWTPMFFIR